MARITITPVNDTFLSNEPLESTGAVPRPRITITPLDPEPVDAGSLGLPQERTGEAMRFWDDAPVAADDLPARYAADAKVPEQAKLGGDDWGTTVRDRSWMDSLYDTAKVVNAGVHSGVGDAIGYGIEATGEKIGSPGMAEFGKDMRLFEQAAGDKWLKSLSPDGRQMMEKELFDGWKPNLDDQFLGSLVMKAAQSAPGMVATAPVGGVLTKGIGMAGGAILPKVAGALVSGSATPVGQSLFQAAKTQGMYRALADRALSLAPSAVGYGAAEGGLAGLQNAAQTRSQIEGMDPKELYAKSPTFREYVDQAGGDITQAQADLARDAAGDVALKTMISTGTIGILTGGGALGMVSRQGKQAATGGILKAFANGAGEEALQEFPQSGGEAYIQNAAMKEYTDPNMDPWKGVLSAMFEGGAVGGLTGGVLGGAGNVLQSAKARFTKDGKTQPITSTRAAATEAGRVWEGEPESDVPNFNDGHEDMTPGGRAFEDDLRSETAGKTGGFADFANKTAGAKDQPAGVSGSQAKGMAEEKAEGGGLKAEGEADASQSIAGLETRPTNPFAGLKNNTLRQAHQAAWNMLGKEPDNPKNQQSVMDVEAEMVARGMLERPTFGVEGQAEGGGLTAEGEGTAAPGIAGLETRPTMEAVENDIVQEVAPPEAINPDAVVEPGADAGIIAGDQVQPVEETGPGDIAPDIAPVNATDAPVIPPDTATIAPINVPVNAPETDAGLAQQLAAMSDEELIAEMTAMDAQIKKNPGNPNPGLVYIFSAMGDEAKRRMEIRAGVMPMAEGGGLKAEGEKPPIEDEFSPDNLMAEWDRQAAEKDQQAANNTTDASTVPEMGTDSAPAGVTPEADDNQEVYVDVNADEDTIAKASKRLMNVFNAWANKKDARLLDANYFLEGSQRGNEEYFRAMAREANVFIDPLFSREIATSINEFLKREPTPADQPGVDTVTPSPDAAGAADVGVQNDGQNAAGSDDIANDVDGLEPEKNVQNDVQNEGVISEVEAEAAPGSVDDASLIPPTEEPKAGAVEPVAVVEEAAGEVVVKTPMPVQKARGLAPKDQKKYLLKEIDVALEAATAVDPGVPYKGVTDHWKATEILKEEFGTVTIEVPGDGEFTIINTKSHLQEFKKRAKDFPAVPAVSAITLTKKPAPAKSTPTRGRVGGANVEYYNAYKPVPRRAPVIKPNAETVHYQDGYFSDGAYLVAMPEQPKVKTPYADYKEDSFKPDTAGVIERSRKADKPLTIAGELSMVIEGEDQGAKVHLRDTDGNDYFLAADRVDHVMTLHPNARPFVTENRTDGGSAVVFKTLDKVSAVVGVVSVAPEAITERQRERMAELGGKKANDEAGMMNDEQTAEGANDEAGMMNDEQTAEGSKPSLPDGIVRYGRVEKLRKAGTNNIFYTATFYDTEGGPMGRLVDKSTKKDFKTLDEAKAWLRENNAPDEKLFQSVLTGNVRSDVGPSATVTAEQLPNGAIKYTRKGDTREFTTGTVAAFDAYMDQNYFDWPEHRDSVLSKMDPAKFSTKDMTWEELQDKARELKVFKVGMNREDVEAAVNGGGKAAPAYVEPQPGDTIRFTPHDTKFQVPVEGIVRESINNGDGFHVFTGGKEDPHRVDRIWKDKGTIEILKAAAGESQARPAPTEKAPAKKSVHDHSSTQINLPPENARAIMDFGSRIPDSEIYTDPNDDSYGREKQPHVTVRYGMDTVDPQEIAPAFAEVGPIRARMGKVSIFESDKYDVVKVDIESTDLHSVNKKVGDTVDLPGETFKNYQPHSTIAYVKKGEGKKYIGDKSFEGKEIIVDEVSLVAKDGKSHTFKLSDTKAAGPEKAAANIEDEFSPDNLMAEWDKQAEGAKVKEKAAEVKQHLSNAMDKFKQINALFGDRGSLSNKEMDENIYAQIKPLLQDALNDILKAGQSAKEFVGLAIENLSTQARPYFERFVRGDMVVAKAEGGGLKAEGDKDAGAGDAGLETRPTKKLTDAENGAIIKDRDETKTQAEEEGHDGRGDQSVSATGDSQGGMVPATGDGQRPGMEDHHAGPDQDVLADESGTGKQGPESELLPGPGGMEGQQAPDGTGEGVSGNRPDGVVSVPTGRGDESDPAHLDAVNYNLEDAPPLSLTKGQRREINDQAKALISRGGPFTNDEKNILRQYTGEGGLGSGQKESLNQHYTDYPTISAIFRAIFDAVKNTAFKIKKALEPSVGSGNFVGMRPDLDWTTVDIDATNHAIVQALYPKARHYLTSFENLKKAGFDLVVSNVPFLEQRGKEALTNRPDIKALHDFYFVHALDRVRDNGIVAFITSRGTMDKKTDAVRREVVGKADILAAFRLPGGHFEKNAHTSVITDVIFMQKRPEGAVPSASQQAINEAFVTSSETEDGIFLNNYYHDRMENMLGTVEVGKDKARFWKETYKISGPAELSKMGFSYRPYEVDDSRARPAPTEKEAIPRDSEEFYSWADANNVVYRLSAITRTFTNRDGTTESYTQPGMEGFDRGILIENGRALVLDQTISFSDVEGQAKTYKPAPDELSKKILILQRIADHIRDFQLHDDGDAQDNGVYQIEQYQKLFKIHPAKDKALKTLMTDAGEKTYFAELSTLFKADFGLPDSLTTKTRYTGSGQAEVTKDSPLKVRAFAAEDSKGIIRLSDAPLIDKAEVAALLTDGYALVGHGVIQNDILYYSGNIYQKINDAENLRETVTSKTLREAIDRQRAQLDNLKPEPKSIDDIRFKGKESWAMDILRRAGVRIDKITNQEDGSIHYNYYGPDAYERFLNNKQLVSRGKDESTASFMERVREAEGVVADESARIRDAVKARPELLEAFEHAYNSRFRNYVPPAYDQAAYLVADVLAEIEQNSPIRLRKNQIKWLVQAVYEGKGINAHDVGGGKTFASIALARALKRRGAAKKPMFVVPAKTIKKWERDIKTLFPDAKIVNLGKLAADTRTKQLFELSHTNADYVLISHEGFAHLQLPKEKEIEYVNALLAEHIDDPEASGREAAKIDDDIATMRRVITESRRDTRLTFDKLGIDMIVADEAHNFKNIGVRGALAKNGLGASFGITTQEAKFQWPREYLKDGETVWGVTHPVTKAILGNKFYSTFEEAHLAANDDYIQHGVAVPAKAALSSARSYDFRFKANYITDTNNGNNVFLLTATPTPNKPMEIYTMLRHLSPTVFHEYGIQTDKDFADQFFDIGTVEDRSKGKPVNVLRAIVNAIDLRGILYRFVDKVRMEEMPWITVPEENAMRHFLEQSMGYAEVAEDLKRRSDNMPSKPEPGEDRPINLYTAGRAASVDPRLYGDSHAQVTVDARSYESTDDKIQFTIENVAKTFRKDKTSGQLIFLDAAGHQQTARGAMAEDLHTEMKRELVALGFDPKEIAIINGKVITNPNTGRESGSGDKDQRKQEIADAYNAGKIKVIIGTTASMGEGMDLQVNTTDIWHVDIPFKPGDIRQRNGRGVRYGNLKGKVNTHYLLMKGTFDAMSFDLVLKKKGWNEAIWDKETADVISTEEEMTGGAMPRRQQILIELETDPGRKAELMIGFRMDQLNEERRQALQSDYHVRSKQLSAANMIEDAKTVLASREKALAALAPDMEITDEKERQTHFNRSRGHLTRNIAASHKRIETLQGRLHDLSPKAEKAAEEVAKTTSRVIDFESRFLDNEGKVMVPPGFNVNAPRFFDDDPVVNAADSGEGIRFQEGGSNDELGMMNDDLSFWDAEAERVMQHVGKAKVIYEHEAEFVKNGPPGAEGKKAYIDSSKPVPEIHVNLDREDKTSVFHEYAHYGVNRVRAANPAFIAEGIRLAGGSEEKLVQAIAEKGKNITDRENRSKFLAWLDKLYASVRRMMKKTFRVDMTLDDFVEVFAYRLRERGGVEKLMGEGRGLKAEGQADAARAVAGFETRPTMGVAFQSDDAADPSALSPQSSALSEAHRPSWLKRMLENHPGVKLWDFLSKTGPEWAGEKSDIIDKVNSAIITGYREDAAFSRLRKDHENRLLMRRQKATELARVLASFPAAEQARLGQIIEGSITMAPKRYAAALKTAEEFMALEKELQELGLLGEENRFRQMSKKEIAAKFREIGKLEADILKKEAQVRPIVNANIQRRANGMAEAVARVIAPNLSKTALMSKDIQARIDQAFTKYEADVVTALMTRGLSEGEAMTIAERIRKAVGVEMERDPRGRTEREAWEIISRAAVWEVTAGLEKIKPFTPENMAGARAEIVKELRDLEAKRGKILERIQTHYKMSGKQYLRMAYDTIENDKAFLKHFKNAMKYHRLRRGYEIQRKDYNEMVRKNKAADLAAAWRAENPGKALDAGVRAELDAKAVEAARREFAKWKWDHRLAAPLLAMKGMSEEAHDAEMMRLFKGIAENPEWSASEGEIKEALAGDSRAWPAPTGKMPDYHRWKQLQKTDKLGPLAGRWVRPEIYDYLDRVMDTRSDAGKLYDEVLRLWKTGKVVYNPAAQMRNIMSNIILANMAGVGFHRVDIYMKAAKEMKAQGKEWKAAEAAGLFGVEWAGHEITSFLDGMENLEPGSKSIFKNPGKLAKTLLALPGKSYQAIEQYYKFVVFVSEREKGKSVTDAKEHSEKWLFNYTDIPKAIRIARRWYSPFITFTYKAMPRFVEISLTKPWKMAEYWALMAGVELLTRTLRGESDDDQEKERKVLPAYMRRWILPFQLAHLRIPYTDKYGRTKYLDLTYILPWGDIGEQWGQSPIKWIPRSFLPSHPLAVFAGELMFNTNAFTGKEMYEEDVDTTGEVWEKYGMELWRQAVPSLAPGGFGFNKLMAAAAGDKDWAGRDRNVPEAVFDTLLGLKVRSIDYTEERGRRMYEFRDTLQKIKSNFKGDYHRIAEMSRSDDDEKQREREADLYADYNERVERVMEKVRGLDE